MEKLSLVRRLGVAIMAVTAGTSLASELALNAMFTDNMVFAENKPMRVFGTGTGTVKVAFDGEEATVASENDAWCATLPAHAAGSGYSLKVYFDDSEHATLENVGVGEVFLMSGQSNMQFVLGRSSYPKADYADEPLLRCFTVTRLEKDKDSSKEPPPFHSDDGWQVCAKASAERWSTLAYLVGLERVKDRKVPVGMVVCAQGASCISTWLPAGMTSDIPDWVMYGDYTQYAWNNNPRGQAYDGMFKTIVPFSFTRAMWYQGESDTGRGGKDYYAGALLKMIALWRSDLQDDALPFSVVQIANLDSRPDENWSGVQAQQALAAEQGTALTLVPSSDLSTSYDIHPVDKTRLAKRMAYVMWKPPAEPEGAGSVTDKTVDTTLNPSCLGAANASIDTFVTGFGWSPWPGIWLNTWDAPRLGSYLIVR